MTENTYEVIVGNIGRVHEGSNKRIANREYNEYVRLSKLHRGRASGEDVTLTCNGDELKSYSGWNQNNQEERIRQ